MSLAKSATGQLISRSNRVVTIQDDFDGEAQNFTAQFFITGRAPFPPTLPSFGNITPVGEVLWNLGGNAQRRLVSIYDGSAITGVAEHFTIKVNDQTDPNDASNQTQYDVTITVAKGVRGSTALPPIYQTYITKAGTTRFGIFSLAPTEIFLLPIPTNAGVNSVMVTAAVSATVLTGAEFQFFQGSGTAANLKEYNPTQYNFVPLSPQAAVLVFANLTPAVGGVTIQFSVTWGIDG